MFDLVDHQPLKQLLGDFDAQMKPIAAGCHGVVGLIHVRRAHPTTALIHGRMLTGFSLEEGMSCEGEEENTGNKHPFVLEVRLKDQGALYTKARPGKEYVVQDGLLLTGQNPASAKQLARRLGDLVEQCATHDYQQVNVTCSLPKTLITCHVALTNGNAQILNRLKRAHLEYIQRNQHLIVLSGSALFAEPVNVTHQDSSNMVIVLATQDRRQAQHFIDHEPYAASKQIFDTVSIKPFKALLTGMNNQQILHYHLQQELFKSQQQHP